MALDLIAEARKTEINGRLFKLNTQRLGNLLNQKRSRLPFAIGPPMIYGERFALTLPKWASRRW